MSEHPFDDFQFSIPLTGENEKYLKSKEYIRRSGTTAYPEDRTIFVVVPFKKWYWEDVGKGRAVHLTFEEVTTITRKLVINKN